MAEYEVDQILSKRVRNGKVKYQIRWKGFNEREDTWEPEENLTHCYDLLAEYDNDRERELTLINQVITNFPPNMNGPGTPMKSPLPGSTPMRRHNQQREIFEAVFASHRRADLNGHKSTDIQPCTRPEVQTQPQFGISDDKPVSRWPFLLSAMVLVAAVVYKILYQPGTP